MRVSRCTAQLLRYNNHTPISLLLTSNAFVQASRLVSVQSSLRGANQYSTWPKAPWVCPASVSGLRTFTSCSSRLQSVDAKFNYRISSSFSAKNHALDPERNLFSLDPVARVHRGASSRIEKQKRPRSGQDSFFASLVGSTDTIAFGVADGVGGWQDQGVDPADFAHGLCEYMAAGASEHPAHLLKGPLRPKDLMQFGYTQVIKDKSIKAGGSTACVATASSNGDVEIANLGDSGFVHFGLNAVRYASEPQTHAFNTPYQLSKIPEVQQRQMRLFDVSSALADLPRDADVTHHRVQHGDVLVFASDGVWDNLSHQDLLNIVSRHMLSQGAWVKSGDDFKIGANLEKLTSAETQAQRSTLQAILALAVTREAKDAGWNPKRDGPFAKEVQKYYPGENWHGGKPDDIVVVVAVVVEGAAKQGGS